MVCAACRERDEPSAKAGKLIRRQLDDSFGDFFDFHVGLAFILRMSGNVAAGARLVAVPASQGLLPVAAFLAGVFHPILSGLR